MAESGGSDSRTSHAGSAAIRWRLAPGAECADGPDGSVVRRGGVVVPVPVEPPPGIGAILELLTEDGVAEPEIAELLSRAGNDRPAHAMAWLLRLRGAGLISDVLALDGTDHMSRTMGSRRCRLASFDPGAEHTLSRFAHCRRIGGEMVLESPLSGWRVTLQTAEALAWLSGLSTRQGEDLPAAATRFLGEAGMLARAGVDGRATDEDTLPVRTWEFHDLLFHTRSRRGRHGGVLGGTYRFGDEIAPPALRREPPEGASVIPLPMPGNTIGPGLFETLGRRRSSRPESAEIHLDRLAELLYRSARAQRVDEAGGTSWRSYPTGGAIGELEVYVVADRCRGLGPGMYRYDALDHALVSLGSREDDRERLLRSAAAAQGRADGPAALLLLASRFARVACKYEGIAYALILKNAGCLVQTIYLVATALEMPVCAVGTGDSIGFARATGLPEHEEGPVAEVTLG